MPPNFPGYRPYCPYTLKPSPAGAWTLADRAAATRLIKASGTSGMRVTVWSYWEFAAVSRYFVKLLDSLGYRARLRDLGPNFLKFARFVNDSRNKAQMAAQWWSFVPTPSSATEPLRCRSFSPNDGDNTNTAEFCSQALEAKIEHALRLQASDPAAAARHGRRPTGRSWTRHRPSHCSSRRVSTWCPSESATISTTRPWEPSSASYGSSEEASERRPEPEGHRRPAGHARPTWHPANIG